MKTTGNTILITGGGSGIGRGLAEAFHRLGNRVLITGRRREVLDAVVAANPGMQSRVLDVRDPARLAEFASRIASELPGLNVLINNAGIMQPEIIGNTAGDSAIAAATIETNLLAPIRLTVLLLAQLSRQAQATIINVSSGLAFLPLAATPTYSATKAALHSYTESLRFQLRKSNVEVLELAPPYVATELMGAHQAHDPHAMPLEEFIAEVVGILRDGLEAGEILVKRVRPLRFAGAQGADKYAQLFLGLNERSPEIAN